MRYYVTRHGETDWNALHRTQGRTDLELNARGMEQAARLANRMTEKDLCAVYVSPMKRAIQTAQPIADRCHVPLIVDERLTERDFGPLEGLNIMELQAKYPREMETWFYRPYDHRQEGVEPIPDMLLRVTSFLEDIRKKHKKNDNIMIVTHGTVAGLIILNLMDMSYHMLHRVGVSNCSYTEIKTGDLPFSFLFTLNDLSHLEGVI